MIESFLIAYFLHHFQIQRDTTPPPVPRSVYVRNLEGGRLTVRSHPQGGRTIAPGMQRIPMLDIMIDASCTSDVALYDLTVRRKGLGLNSDIDRVYVMSNGKRISRTRQVSNNRGDISFHFRNQIIPACGSKTLSVFADFSTSASIAGEHTFVIENEYDLGSSASKIILDKGPMVYPTKRTSGRVIGTISVDYLNVTSPVRYGNNRTIQRFVLEADNRTHHIIESITFTNEGSARNADLQDLYLQAGRKIMTNILPWMEGDRITFYFDPPVSLRKNHRRKFELKADVMASRSRTIRLEIEEPSDIVAEPVLGR